MKLTFLGEEVAVTALSKLYDGAPTQVRNE